MIGWVPFLLSEFVQQVGGAEARNAILVEAGFDPGIPIQINASYADAKCRRMLDVACQHFSITEAQAFERFAPFFLARSREMFPGFFRQRPTVRAFLLHQPEVHNTLGAGLGESQRCHVAGKFHVEAVPGGVRVFYRSANRLAGLYAAVAVCLGEEFGQPTQVRFEAGGPQDAECVMLIEVDETATPAAA